jgi:uncharacterized surface protein with fasciclin (FAS1) repeats
MGDFVAAAPFLSTLAKAIDVAGLKGELNLGGPYTLFAPDNAAFARVPKPTLDALFADKAKLRAVLLHHVVKGQVDALTLIRSQPTLQAMDGRKLGVVKKPAFGGVHVDGALLIGSNMVATNGLVHIVNTLIGVGVPPTVPPTTVARSGVRATTAPVRTTTTLKR